eukprot:UN30068
MGVILHFIYALNRTYYGKFHSDEEMKITLFLHGIITISGTNQITKKTFPLCQWFYTFSSLRHYLLLIPLFSLFARKRDTMTLFGSILLFIVCGGIMFWLIIYGLMQNTLPIWIV